MLGVDGNWGAGVGSLIDALLTVGARHPTARLYANLMGNLAIVVPDPDDPSTGRQVGWVGVGNERVGGAYVKWVDYE